MRDDVDTNKAMDLACQWSSRAVVEIIANDVRTILTQKHIKQAIMGDNVQVLEYLLINPGLFVDNSYLREAIHIGSTQCANYLLQDPWVSATSWGSHW